MKNKKVAIILIIILIVCAIAFGIFMARSHVGNQLFNEDGTAVDGHKELIEHLKKVEDKDERKKQIDFSVEQNLITKKEAESLY